MKKILALAATLAVSTAALADHHGRGREQVNGFPSMYDLGIGVATFTGDGYLVIVSKNSRAPIAIMTYEVAESMLTLRDISPPTFASQESKDCQIANSGLYRMDDIEGGFNLVVEKDPCADRARLLPRFTFKDYVRPEPAEAP